MPGWRRHGAVGVYTFGDCDIEVGYNGLVIIGYTFAVGIW